MLLQWYLILFFLIHNSLYMRPSFYYFSHLCKLLGNSFSSLNLETLCCCTEVCVCVCVCARVCVLPIHILPYNFHYFDAISCLRFTSFLLPDFIVLGTSFLKNPSWWLTPLL